MTVVKLTFGPGVSSLHRDPTGCVAAGIVRDYGGTSVLIMRPGMGRRGIFGLASCGRTCSGTSVIMFLATRAPFGRLR